MVTSIKKYIVLIVIGIVGSVADGVIFSKLWLWFVIPAYKFQPIEILPSIGLMMICYIIVLSFFSSRILSLLNNKL